MIIVRHTFLLLSICLSASALGQINIKPLIAGQLPLSTAKNVPITIQFSHLIVVDADDPYPAGFTLKLYAGKKFTFTGATVIPEKDETDRLVIAEAERLNLPVLAICYGMQALNVYRGGTLIQDIGSQLPRSNKHEQGAPATRNSHSLKVADGSILAGLDAVKASKGDIRVNSSHHQAINKVGKNLKAVAWAKDRVVESIQDTRKNRFMLGVQWHPELTRGHDEISREIFALFVAKCSKLATNR